MSNGTVCARCHQDLIPHPLGVGWTNTWGNLYCPDGLQPHTPAELGAD